VTSSIELNGKPRVCDCPMFNTIYFWCRDVDLELCSNPPKFKDTSCTIYNAFGCFDSDCITDIVEEVEGIVMNNDKFLRNTICEEYEQNENF